MMNDPCRSMLDETGIDKHDVFMPILNGPRVRHLAASRGLDLPTLAKRCGIHKRSLQNATRGRNPDNIALPRVYRIASELADTPGSVEALVAEILANNDGVPDEPPKQPQRPAAPPRRTDKPTRGPKRAQTGTPA